MAERASSRNEFKGRVADRIPSLTQPGTVFEYFISHAKKFVAEDSAQGVDDFTLRVPNVGQMRVRLLENGNRDFSDSSPPYHAVETVIAFNGAPAIAINYGGPIGGVGYFKGESNYVTVYGVDQKNMYTRTTEQILKMTPETDQAEVITITPDVVLPEERHKYVTNFDLTSAPDPVRLKLKETQTNGQTHVDLLTLQHHEKQIGFYLATPDRGPEAFTIPASLGVGI